MKTYKAYKLVHANDEDGKNRGVIWWDGKHVRASSDELLARVKKIVIPFSLDIKAPLPTYKDGEQFFKMLPLAFRTGYVHLEPATVDETGEDV